MKDVNRSDALYWLTVEALISSWNKFLFRINLFRLMLTKSICKHTYLGVFNFCYVFSRTFCYKVIRENRENVTKLVMIIVKRCCFWFWDLPFIHFKSEQLCGKPVASVPIFTWMNWNACQKIGHFMNVLLYATVYVFEILQKLCHLPIHLLIISHTVSERKCSLFSLAKPKLNQKSNLFDLV